MKGTYKIFVQGYDYGCGVTKAILTLEKPLETINKEDFIITETKQICDFSKFPICPVIEATLPRTITDVYYANENGEKVEAPSKHVTIEMYVSPQEGSPLLFSFSTMFNTWSKPYYLTITNKDNTLEIEKEFTEKLTSVDHFTYKEYTTTQGIQYKYATYEPETKTNNCIIWLHGLGEGGTVDTDAMIPLLGNKAAALSSKKFQELAGPLNVLSIQCPTYWMDNDGSGSNLMGGEIKLDGTSYYTESVMELIRAYKKEMNIEKSVLVGCSNGGFMTMLLAMNYPDEFDCYIPICEAYTDKLISDEQIQILKDLPMYFYWSMDDTTVIPSIHEIPTVKRLKEAGAKNIHTSISEFVIGNSDLFDKEGNPYKYMGHWSWIYFFNNVAINDVEPWPWIKETLK